MGFENGMINSYAGASKMIDRRTDWCRYIDRGHLNMVLVIFAGMFGDKYQARPEGADYNIGLKVGYNKRSADKVNLYQSCAVC